LTSAIFYDGNSQLSVGILTEIFGRVSEKCKFLLRLLLTHDGVCRVCQRMLENDSQSFLQLPAIDNVVQYASVASTMLHTEAQSSALRFLLVLIDVADPDAVSNGFACYLVYYVATIISRCSGKFVAPENNSHVQQYGLELRLGLGLGLGYG